MKFQWKIWYWRQRPTNRPPRTKIVTIEAPDFDSAVKRLDRGLFMTRWHVQSYLGPVSRETETEACAL